MLSLPWLWKLFRLWSGNWDPVSHVCVPAKLLQPCLTLCDPIDCSPPGSSVCGIFQARILELGCHALLQGLFPTQGSNLSLICLLHRQTGSLPPLPPGKPPVSHTLWLKEKKRIVWWHKIIIRTIIKWWVHSYHSRFFIQTKSLLVSSLWVLVGVPQPIRYVTKLLKI